MSAPAAALNLALSPYHLTSLEVGAMAALQLGDTIVTWLPTPPGGETREALAEAVAHSPRYRRVLETWARLGPLWSSGLLRSLALATNAADPPSPHAPSPDALTSILAAAHRLERDPAWAALRGFAHAEAFNPADESLDELCADLLKGGPDPGLALPITSGLDAFALAHALTSVRSVGAAAGLRQSLSTAGLSAGSLAQQAEARLARVTLSIGLPLLTQASAKTIMLARDVLEQERLALATAIAAGSATAARAASASYAAAFKDRLGHVIGRDDDRRARVVGGFASLHLRETPADAAFMAAMLALGKPPAAPRGPGQPPTLRTLTVTAMPVTLS